MATTYISSGTNLGKRETYLEEARNQIEKHCGKILQRSSIYETEPWGESNQPWFLNEVLKVETSLLPADLMENLLNVEKQCGRKERKKWTEREIDLDILFYDDLRIKDDGLCIPHPRIGERRFNLIPLNELNPELKHPESGISIGKLLEKCHDPLKVSLYQAHVV